MNYNLLPENGIEREEWRVQADISYRAFRAEILPQCRDEWSPRWGDAETASAFTIGRRKIHAFRRHLVFRAAGWIADGQYPRQHIDRALGLDPAFTLTLSRRERWLRAWMRFLPSTHTVMRLARPWLRQARTFEGRWFIVRERLPNGIATNRIHFNRTLDYGLRYWGAFPSEKAMNEFSRIHFDWIRAARYLGLNDLKLMLAWIPQLPHVDSGQLMWVLVREGVITHPDERVWVDQSQRRASFAGSQELDERRIREVIGILRRYGIERQRIVEALCTLPHHYLKPELLARTLDLLGDRGINDYGRLLSGLGTCLSNVPAERWMMLLDQLGVRETEALLQFEPLLNSHEPCSVELGQALIAHGASAADLALCQKVLLATGTAQDRQAPVAALSMLMSPPYSFQFAQVAEAAIYLGQFDALPAFLDVLHQYGFGDADAVLRFQPCYTTVQAPRLGRLIALTQSLNIRAEITEVIEWINYAGNGEHIDAYEYLADALKVRTVRQLRQVARVAFLGEEVLRHLVEKHCLRTRKALTDWFYERAFGIKSVRWWGTSLDPVNKLLFDDAFTRQTFNYWESNRQCVYDVVHARVTNALGNFPLTGTEAERRNYWAADEALTIEMRAALLPTLPTMLEATSGILLPSVAASAWSDIRALKRQLAQLAPLLDDLLVGRGPVPSTLTQLEAEAIALVYRTTPATVLHHWQQLVGHESDIADWGTVSRYTMTWRHARLTLRSPLNRTGLEAVGAAARWAAAFRQMYKTDMARACVGLAHASPGVVEDLYDLVPRLGVLLAIAVDAPRAAASIEAVSDWLTKPDDLSYEQVLNMQTFFSIGLADALHAQGEAFCRTLAPWPAALLLRQLNAHAAEGDSRSALQQQLLHLTRDIGGRFSDWASRELTKFGVEKAGDHSIEMNAVVTKHPAAFFAKEAAKLCTANNVLMWKETRQAHLVVFNPAQRSIQGMALLYREILPRVHPSRPVLVIRAINPTGDAMATYHVSSIVDAFLTTAVWVARNSGCAAVAFPPNTSQHLLSNLDPINKDVLERYVMRGSVCGRRPALDGDEQLLCPAEEIGVVFDAYERGEHQINQLYLVWRSRA